MNYIKDDEACLIVCSPKTAKFVIEENNDKDVAEVMVITAIMPEDAVCIIPEEKFIDFICSDEFEWFEKK